MRRHRRPLLAVVLRAALVPVEFAFDVIEGIGRVRHTLRTLDANTTREARDHDAY